MTAAVDAPAFEPRHTRALGWMAAAGIALGVAPSALWAIFGHSAGAELELFAYPPLSNLMAALFVVILAACVVALAGGLVAAVSLARKGSTTRRAAVRWLALAVPFLAALAFPPFWFLGLVWMFISVTLAVRARWWGLEALDAAPVDRASRRARCRTWGVGLTLLSHVAAWGAVLAVSFPVSDEEFARIESERHARAVAPAQAHSDGIDFIEVDGGGALAAGRYVGGDMSGAQFSVGPWPAIAQWLIVPDGSDNPTERESWLVAALAFIASTLFWTPWVLLWTGRVCREAQQLHAGT